jgi:hypothetical protein
MRGRGVFVAVASFALLGCLDGRSDRADRSSAPGGTSGWVEVTGPGSAGSGGSAGRRGTDAGAAPPCLVADPQYPDASVVAQQIDIAWCDAAHTCAICTWRFPGVGIFISAQPTASCTLPLFTCPAAPGGPTADGGVPICPSTVSGADYDQGHILFEETWSPYECQVWDSADAGPGGDLTSCQLGGFTCATSCSACP